MFALFEADPIWQEIAKYVAVTLGGTVLGYWLNRPKQKAEVHQTLSEARKTDAETTIIMTGQIVDLLDRLETAKRKSQEVEATLAEVTRALDNCLKEKCDNCRKILDSTT